MNKLSVSRFRFSRLFWDIVFSNIDELRPDYEQLLSVLREVNGLRSEADYQTGTIGPATACCLYFCARYFGPSYVAEVGTFIGRSTLSMAMALDHAGIAGAEISTCDVSNDIDIHWAGQTKIRQFKRCSSVQMFESLTSIDFLFVDGRLSSEDFTVLKTKTSSNTMVVLDDF